LKRATLGRCLGVAHADNRALEATEARAGEQQQQQQQQQLLVRVVRHQVFPAHT